MTPISISLNWFLLTRLLLATLWGIILALFLQFNRWGRFLAQERTWLTVVVGVGVDLLISFGADWGTTTAVIVLSSAGIIARSLLNESKRRPGEGKVLWGVGDATTLTNELLCLLQEVIESSSQGALGVTTASAGRALILAYEIRETLTMAGRGEYRPRKD